MIIANSSKFIMCRWLIIVTFFCLALLGIQCEQQQPVGDEIDKPVVLPEYTEYGANSFAWIINEKELYIANDNWPTDTRINGFYVPSRGQLEVRGSHYEKNFNSDMRIYLRNVFTPGSFIADESSNYLNYYYNGLDGTEDKGFYTDSLHLGEVTITKLDTVNRIVAGKFTCRLRRYGSGNIPFPDTLTINGQFDFNYPPKN